MGNKQTQEMPICICGQFMTLKKAKSCYKNPGGVFCDKCSVQVKSSSLIYHCDKGFDQAHTVGFDLCDKCGDEVAQNSQTLNKPIQFLIVPKEIESEMDSGCGFELRQLHYWCKGPKQNISHKIQSMPSEVSSLTTYLQTSQGKYIKNDYIEFNDKQSTNEFHQKYNYPAEDDENEKFRENIFKQRVWGSSRFQSSINTFPTLIAEIKEMRFPAHDELQKCMNLYQMNDVDDISNRRMTEKMNVNKKWNVVGLIDPDKHLSTLDHSLNLHSFHEDRLIFSFNDVMNYHHWIPSVFQVNNELTNCELLTEIANLDPYKYKYTLYALIKQLFLFQLPQFENITNYNLRDIALKVVVKAQDYQLFDCGADDSYLGNMHKEGLYEDIIAVGLYYYQIDDQVIGGQLQLSSVINLKDTQYREGATTLKQTEIDVKEGTSLVFSNDNCYHRVNKLYGSGSRKILAFFLLRPNISKNATISIDARYVVVNWKFHAKHLVVKWLKEEGSMNGYNWILNVIFEYVVGHKIFIENATEIYNECRRAYADHITYDVADITSEGRDLSMFEAIDEIAYMFNTVD